LSQATRCSVRSVDLISSSASRSIGCSSILREVFICGGSRLRHDFIVSQPHPTSVFSLRHDIIVSCVSSTAMTGAAFSGRYGKKGQDLIHPERAECSLLMIIAKQQIPFDAMYGQLPFRALPHPVHIDDLNGSSDIQAVTHKLGLPSGRSTSYEHIFSLILYTRIYVLIQLKNVRCLYVVANDRSLERMSCRLQL